jgi:hypothetical protein
MKKQSKQSKKDIGTSKILEKIANARANLHPYAENRMTSATLKAAHEVGKKELFKKKLGEKISKITGNLAKGLLKKPKSRSFIRKGVKASIVLNQPVYTEDKQRFFNHAVNEERKRLYFS